MKCARLWAAARLHVPSLYFLINNFAILTIIILFVLHPHRALIINSRAPIHLNCNQNDIIVHLLAQRCPTVSVVIHNQSPLHNVP